MDSLDRLHVAMEAEIEIVQGEQECGNRKKCEDVAISQDDCRVLTCCIPNGCVEIGNYLY